MDNYTPYDRSYKHDWRAEFKRLDGAYAPATIRSYLTDVAIFERWCDDHGRTFLPATAEAVCAFLEDQAPALAPSTVRRRLYAIRKAHRLLGLADPTFAEDINLTIRRVRRQKPGRPRQAKGLTRPYLDAFLAVQPNTVWGLRNRAMLALGYNCSPAARSWWP